MNQEPDLFEEALEENAVADDGGKRRFVEAQASSEGDDGETVQLGLYAEKSYLEYAMSVVKSRALPQVVDLLQAGGGFVRVRRAVAVSESVPRGQAGLARREQPRPADR